MVTNIQTTISLILEEVVRFSITNIIPAMIVLLFGIIIGKIIGKIIRNTMEKLKIDYYLTETEKPSISVTNIFSMLVRWWIYILFLSQSVRLLSLPELTLVMQSILSFIPTIIAASSVVLVGYIIGENVKETFKNTRKDHYTIFGKIMFFFIIYVAVAVALPILNISSELISNILLIIIGSIGLGIAIALGLGLKESVSYISRRYVKKLKL